MKISQGMGLGIRKGIRVPVAVAVVVVVGRTGLNLLHLRLPLRRGIRYIEGDRGRGVLGATEMSRMVLEGSSFLKDRAPLTHKFIKEDTTLCLLRSERYSTSRSGGRSFEKWVRGLTVSWCLSIPCFFHVHEPDSSGQSRSAADEITGEVVAIKLVTRVTERVQLSKRALREITLLRHFANHENITGLIDVDASSPNLEEMWVLCRLPFVPGFSDPST